MKIPKKIKIMGHKYKVKKDKKIFIETNYGGGSACANALVIKVSPDVPESRQAEILLHEIIEMLKYSLQVQLEHKDLSALSEGLFSVIRDNKLDFRK